MSMAMITYWLPLFEGCIKNYLYGNFQAFIKENAQSHPTIEQKLVVCEKSGQQNPYRNQASSRANSVSLAPPFRVNRETRRRDDECARFHTNVFKYHKVAKDITISLPSDDVPLLSENDT